VPAPLAALFTLTLAAGAVTALGAAPAAAADDPAVAPVLLQVDRPRVRAVDVSPLGVVVATSSPARADIPVGGEVDGSVPQRWIPLPRGGYATQKLPLPQGSSGAVVAGVGDLGEVGATVGFGTPESAHAYRWGVAGLRSTDLTPGVPSSASAVGPGGQVMVDTGDPVFGGTTSIARRDGSLRPVTSLPGRSAGGRSVAGNDLALAGVIDGVGQGTTVTPWLWQAGASVALPVVSSFFFGPACASELTRDGAVAYSGLRRSPIGFVVGIHRGGVPGTETLLPVPEGRTGSLGCPEARDVLATDGTVAGVLQPSGTEPGEAVIWHDDQLVRIGVRAGEASTAAVAVATGGRAVIIAAAPGTGVLTPYLWKAGVRTPLTVPSGWRLDDVVELTEGGDVVANVVAPDGVTTRPVVWRTGR
jgi:hypothetical protein